MNVLRNNSMESLMGRENALLSFLRMLRYMYDFPKFFYLIYWAASSNAKEKPSSHLKLCVLKKIWSK